MAWTWLVVLGVVVGLLAVAWRMDAVARRRGARTAHHSDVWFEVRESRRDAEVGSRTGQDQSWTSWSRRNRR